MSPKKLGRLKRKTKNPSPSSKIEQVERSNLRIPVQLLVKYKTGEGNYLFDFCRDFGTGGVFIKTESPLARESQVDLTFTMPDSNETLLIKGKVIWVQTKVPDQGLTSGMGVQFTAFDTEQRKQLEAFMERVEEPQG
jgi:type IV pilus assembly protein PilZ